ncbi:MAG: hypothetical protein HYW86_00675 [Candidatus Roizmanbacteria bacterium]|nr:MAG: hypothetical protein HYW86_00675 [Candidatus Roizmanbacteria bacterium]
MENTSKAQKNFISHLLKRDPKLGDKDIPPLLSSFKRFVKVVQRIYTEPQAQITIKNKQRIITTDLEEFRKVITKGKGPQSFSETFDKLNKAVTKDKYGR